MGLLGELARGNHGPFGRKEVTCAFVAGISQHGHGFQERAQHVQDILTQALAAAITSDSYRARALTGLAPHLPPDQLTQAAGFATGSAQTLAALLKRAWLLHERENCLPYVFLLRSCLINDAALDRAHLAVAHARRGETCRLTGRFGDAPADFSRAIELDPGQAWIIGSRGETYRQMGRYEEALADLSRAVELGPCR